MLNHRPWPGLIRLWAEGRLRVGRGVGLRGRQRGRAEGRQRVGMRGRAEGRQRGRAEGRQRGGAEM